MESASGRVVTTQVWESWAVVMFDAAACTLLLLAGTAKIASPRPAAAALDELFRWRVGSPSWAVRAVSIVELATAFALVVPATRSLGHASMASLGFAFLALGVAGRLRGSSRPCGCFGAGGSRPLGLVNVVVGLALLLVSSVETTVQPAAVASRMSIDVALVTTVVTTAWLLVASRRQARLVFGNLFRGTESAT